MPDGMPPRYQGDEGIWVIYMYDVGPIPQSMHFTDREAILGLRSFSGSKIAFWPKGMEFAEAITQWEAED